MNGSPHLPTNIRRWFGDSRGRWEAETLVIDVTNFSPRTDVENDANDPNRAGTEAAGLQAGRCSENGRSP
jgi:hypothetical protein